MMKRAISIVLAILLVAALFVGCGSSSSSAPSESPLGTYRAKTVNGKDLKSYYTESWEVENDEQMETMMSLFGVDKLEDLFVLTLKEDGKFTISMMGVAVDGTWTLSGEKLVLTYEGEPVEGEYRNGEITMEMEGDLLVMAR